VAGLPARVARDERGFSLVEVLFATIILFFVATAILGLVASTTVTAQTARQKNALVNAVNSFIEEVKGYDFDDVGMENPETGEAEGILSETTTITADGFQIVIRPTITWVDDPNITGTEDYKFIRIEAEAQIGAAGSPITYVAETQVRNPDIGWGFGEFSSNTPPEIFFGTDAPEEMEVVSGAAVPISADASHTMDSGVLTNMFFYVGSQPIRNAGWEKASFTINAPTYSMGTPFYWDTTALMDDGETRISPDGIRTVKIEVWDNLGQQAYKIRRVVVDNDMPPAPPPAQYVGSTGDVLSLEWEPLIDGTDPVPGYFVGIDEDCGKGRWLHTHWRCVDDWEPTTYGVSVTSDTEYHDGSLDYDPTPEHYHDYVDEFRRFRVRLYGITASGAWSSMTVSGPFISRPELTGTYVVEATSPSRNQTALKMWNDIYWTDPKFPVSGVEYTLWRSTSADMSGATAVFSSTDEEQMHYQDYEEDSGPSHKTHHNRYYYQLETSFLATGPDSPGEVETVWSNVIGPNGAGNETGELPHTSW
jgi:type II secretory pathway pseudopilin PulG